MKHFLACAIISFCPVSPALASTLSYSLTTTVFDGSVLHEDTAGDIVENPAGLVTDALATTRPEADATSNFRAEPASNLLTVNVGTGKRPGFGDTIEEATGRATLEHEFRASGDGTVSFTFDVEAQQSVLTDDDGRLFDDFLVFGSLRVGELSGSFGDFSQPLIRADEIGSGVSESLSLDLFVGDGDIFSVRYHLGASILSLPAPSFYQGSIDATGLLSFETVGTTLEPVNNDVIPAPVPLPSSLPLLAVAGSVLFGWLRGKPSVLQPT